MVVLGNFSGSKSVGEGKMKARKPPRRRTRRRGNPQPTQDLDEGAEAPQLAAGSSPSSEMESHQFQPQRAWSQAQKTGMIWGSKRLITTHLKVGLEEAPPPLQPMWPYPMKLQLVLRRPRQRQSKRRCQGQHIPCPMHRQLLLLQPFQCTFEERQLSTS